MRREGKQASFAEALVAGGGNRRLEAIEQLIDWAAVERLLAPVYAAPTGRASYPVLSLFKAVLLGAWYGLGDPELEAALSDRLSFRRFAGLALDAPVPDHSSAFATSCAGWIWPRRCSPRSTDSWSGAGWW
jgi:transposase, IS5 family